MKLRVKYQGTFKNRDNNKTYRVTIQNSEIAQTKYIVDPTEYNFKDTRNNVLFDKDPVVITYEREEMTQQILVRQATIKVKANFDLSSTFFADTNRSIKAVIEQKVGNDWVSIFDGYVDPLQFQQGAAYNYESYTIHATDPLGALEDTKVNQLPTLTMSDVPTIKDVITDCINAIGCDIDYSYWETSPNQPNDDISINMINFYGESPDDYMTLREILETLLRYQGAMLYYNPAINKAVIQNMYIDDDTPVDFDFKNNAMDDSTTMSMSDAYNRIKLKCEIEPAPDKIVSLIDDDYLESDYPSYQKYITEMVSPGEGHAAQDGMKQMLRADELEEYTDYDNGFVREHFCWIRKDKRFDFGEHGYDKLQRLDDQSDYLLWMKQKNQNGEEINTGKGILVSYGKTDKITKVDRSARANVAMTTYLQIAVNGHHDLYDQNGHILVLKRYFDENSPVCTYNGLRSQTLTPTEREVTNYVVISGKILLNPIQQRTGLTPGGTWSDNFERDVFIKSQNKYQDIAYHNPSDWWHHTVPGENRYGDYYTHKCWACTNPRNPIYTYKQLDPHGDNPMIGDMGREQNKALEFNYSSYRDPTDTIDYVPVLACELKVGDKYCCENIEWRTNGKKQFWWLTAEEAQDKMLPTYFTIGINPQKGDHIVGQVFEIANTVNHYQNLSGKSGTVIPITIDDQLQGTPEFKILKPYLNMVWKDFNVNYWILPTSLVNSLVGYQYVLERCESIMIQDLNIEPITDNAKYREGMTTADNDLVYTSNENNTYTEDNECDTKVVTPLTIDECLLRGVKYQMSDSYVYHSNSLPFWGFEYGDNYRVKPEEVWVDYMWLQMSSPKKILSTNIRDSVLTDEQSYNTDLGYWMTCGTVSGTIGSESSHFDKGYLTRIEWDLKNRSMDMEIRQASDYTPIWQ